MMNIEYWSCLIYHVVLRTSFYLYAYLLTLFPMITCKYDSQSGVMLILEAQAPIPFLILIRPHRHLHHTPTVKWLQTHA